MDTKIRVNRFELNANAVSSSNDRQGILPIPKST